MIIGTKDFFDKIRSKHLPNVVEKNSWTAFTGKKHWPGKSSGKGCGILKCDLDVIRRSRRIPKSLEDDRDLLVYLVWKTCMLSNQETGRLFGMTYSVISHILSSFRTRIKKAPELQAKYEPIFTMQDVTPSTPDMLQKGTVHLDDPLWKYLPSSINAPVSEGKPISLEHVATHTSGLPRMSDNFKPADPLNAYADYAVEKTYVFLNGHKLKRPSGGIRIFQFRHRASESCAGVSHRYPIRASVDTICKPLWMW